MKHLHILPLPLRGALFCLLALLSSGIVVPAQFKFREPPNRQDPSPLAKAAGDELWDMFLAYRMVGRFSIGGEMVYRPPDAPSSTYEFELLGDWRQGEEITHVKLVPPNSDPLDREVAFREEQWFLVRDSDGSELQVPLNEQSMNERIHESFPFTWMDLLMPYLQWTEVRYVGPDRRLGRPAHRYELINPDPDTFPAKAVVTLDEDFAAILVADLYDRDGFLARRMRIAGFKQFDGEWMFSELNWENRKARSSVRLKVYSFENTN